MEMIFLVAKKNTSTKVQKVIEEVDALGLEEISGNHVLYSICIIQPLMLQNSYFFLYRFQINNQNPVNATFYCS